MIVVNDGVKLKDFEHYGFKVLVDDCDIGEDNYFSTLAIKPLGNHFTAVIENDEYYRQLTIVPNDEFPLKMSLTFQLELIYDLVKANLVTKVN